MIFGNKELTDRITALESALEERGEELQTAIAQRDELTEKAEKLDDALVQISTLEGQLEEATAKISTLETEVAALPEKANELAIKIAAKAGHEPIEVAEDETTGTAPKTLSEALQGITDPVQAAKIRKQWSERINPSKTA
jgi:predicted nuclease with TOPRIM domain